MNKRAHAEMTGGKSLHKKPMRTTTVQCESHSYSTLLSPSLPVTLLHATSWWSPRPTSSWATLASHDGLMKVLTTSVGCS